MQLPVLMFKTSNHLLKYPPNILLSAVVLTFYHPTHLGLLNSLIGLSQTEVGLVVTLVNTPDLLNLQMNI